MSENLKSRKDVANILGVSVKTVYRLERKGLLHSISLSARCVRYREADLAQLISDAHSNRVRLSQLLKA